MKKTYIAPSTDSLKIYSTQMLAESMPVDWELEAEETSDPLVKTDWMEEE